MIRFANPKSDLERLVVNFEVIVRELSGITFDLDMMRDVLASEYHISAAGLTGVSAVEASTRKDRSLDSLYNQVKMMSELYRLLGWLKTGGARLKSFEITNLGGTLAVSGSISANFREGLVRESVLAITMPNPRLGTIRVTSSRPFAFLLELMKEVDGRITRDEIILEVLGRESDLAPGAIEESKERILTLRSGDVIKAAKALEKFREKLGLQEETIKNYTRFPLGVLKSKLLGWSTAGPTSGLYKSGKSNCLQLTEKGLAIASNLSARVDIREQALTDLSIADRAVIAEFGYWKLLSTAGCPVEKCAGDLAASRQTAATVLSNIGISADSLWLYNPELQETDAVLAAVK